MGVKCMQIYDRYELGRRGNDILQSLVGRDWSIISPNMFAYLLIIQRPLVVDI